MKFGVREICDVVFKAKSKVTIGGIEFPKGAPVLYIDSAKTSTIEGAATTVYATGGKGNTRLIAWEGEKTLTFTVEDALLSPMGFAILSGAGLLKGKVTDQKKVHVHTTAQAMIEKDTDNYTIDLTNALTSDEEVCADAPVFVVLTDTDGSLMGTPITNKGDNKITFSRAEDEAKTATLTIPGALITDATVFGEKTSVSCFVDFYVSKDSAAVSELQIDAENFAGFYYVEASTLFRRQDTGVDMPAEITFPNVKIQSNFTFSMASSGDPSTFTFTMDAFPGYTHFNPTKKVLCAIQIVDDDVKAAGAAESVFPCEHDEGN